MLHRFPRPGSVAPYLDAFRHDLEIHAVAFYKLLVRSTEYMTKHTYEP
jgi:hypothetical protein